MYGLALAGGGARGAYEVGAWKAIRETGVGIGAVCGTSIGSINGAVFAQGDAEAAEQLWREITFSDVLDTTGFTEENIFKPENIRALLHQFKVNGGLSMRPLEELLREIVDEERLQKSDIDFGLVTYSLTDFAPIELYKADIPKGRLIDYIMASACLPGIKSRVIDDKVFVDGGVANNKPVNMLVKRGYRDIITVDVGGIGIVKPAGELGINLIEVKCSSPEIGIMEFEKDGIARSIKGGYIDTKRALGKLCGEKYAFRAGDYMRERREFSAELIEGAEICAEAFGIDKLKEYTVVSLARRITREYRDIMKKNDGLGIEAVANSENSRALLLCAAAKAYTAGNADFLNNRMVANIFKEHMRAINALIYFNERFGEKFEKADRISE